MSVSTGVVALVAPTVCLVQADISTGQALPPPQLHDEVVAIKDISRPSRQIAVRNIGREEPTLPLTADRSTKAKNLFACYTERTLVENELSA